MYKREIISKKQFIDNISQINLLKFFLTQKKEQSVYGIEIEKYLLKDNHSILIESENSGFISDNKDLVLDMIFMFSKNIVTPCSLIYIVDEITG